MPLYFFDVKDGKRLVDPTGLNCRDDNEAVAKAEILARQIALETSTLDTLRCVAVLNEVGDEVFKVPVPTSRKT